MLTDLYDLRLNILRTLCLLFGIALSLGTVLQKTAPMSHFKGKVGDSSGPTLAQGKRGGEPCFKLTSLNFNSYHLMASTEIMQTSCHIFRSDQICIRFGFNAQKTGKSDLSLGQN